MRFEGRFRARCIRALVLVLALTASRSNFPLSDPSSASSGSATSGLRNRLSETPRKYEGVTPSRRQVETRRMARIQNRDFQILPKSLTNGALGNLPGSARVLPSRSERGHSTEIALTSPEYLQAFLRSSPCTSLPPPV